MRRQFFQTTFECDFIYILAQNAGNIINCSIRGEVVILAKLLHLVCHQVPIP